MCSISEHSVDYRIVRRFSQAYSSATPALRIGAFFSKSEGFTHLKHLEKHDA
jgi:hypothetical protein